MGEQLLVRAVDEAWKIMAGKCEEYETRTERYVEIEKDHPYIRIVGAVTGVKQHGYGSDRN